jgi:hypothetical protein
VKLDAWMVKNGVGCWCFAGLLNAAKKPSDANISQSMVDRWRKGTVPRRRARERILEATGGEVSHADWLDDATPRKRRDPAISSAASRKAARTRVRRLQEARA